MRLNRLFFLSLLCLSTASAARDIDLDRIYIKSSSVPYKKLVSSKIESYKIAGSKFLDDEVVSAEWASGNEIIYVRETKPSNIIYSYNTLSHEKNELARLTGAILYVKTTHGGRFAIIKRLVQDRSIIPEGEITVLNIESKKIFSIKTAYPFQDFTVKPAGESIIYEDTGGILEHDLFSGTKKIMLERTRYSQIISAYEPASCHVSRSGTSFAVISGSGGNYRTVIISGNRTSEFPGITSPSEFCWLTDTIYAYRSGFAGFFGAHLFNTKTKEKRDLVAVSLNTNISCSRYTPLISVLRDQMINIYKADESDIIVTFLEGEDISFSPDNIRFLSMFNKKLFVTNINILKKRIYDLRKNSAEILKLYELSLTQKKDFENDFSEQYVRRKISLYRGAGR